MRTVAYHPATASDLHCVPLRTVAYLAAYSPELWGVRTHPPFLETGGCVPKLRTGDGIEIFRLLNLEAFSKREAGLTLAGSAGRPEEADMKEVAG